MKDGTRKSGFRIGGIAFFVLCCTLRPSELNAAATDEPKSRAGETVKVEEDLANPVRLEADGEPIDIGKLSSIAHAGPWIADVDEDGDRDLLVGDFPGFFWFFENTGSESAPEYTSRGKLAAGGTAAKTPVY